MLGDRKDGLSRPRRGVRPAFFTRFSSAEHIPSSELSPVRSMIMGVGV